MIKYLRSEHESAVDFQARSEVLTLESKKMTKECRMVYWTDVIQQSQESGLSNRAYCQREGINERTYYYWQRKIRAAANEQIACCPDEMLPATLAAHSFVEVELKAVEQPLEVPELVGSEMISEALPMPLATKLHSSGNGVIYLKLPGIQISADNGYPTAKLLEILRGVVMLC
jgi:hypothetical protein